MFEPTLNQPTCSFQGPDQARRMTPFCGHRMKKQSEWPRILLTAWAWACLIDIPSLMVRSSSQDDAKTYVTASVLLWYIIYYVNIYYNCHMCISKPHEWQCMPYWIDSFAGIGMSVVLCLSFGREATTNMTMKCFHGLQSMVSVHSAASEKSNGGWADELSSEE